MGKHDKDMNFKWGRPEVEAVKISYDPPNDDFYKARISTLERENMELHNRVTELEQSLGQMELVIDHDEEVTNGLISEYKDEIEVLKGKIKMLEAAIVKGALREVLA